MSIWSVLAKLWSNITQNFDHKSPMLYIPLERAFKALLESVLTFDPKFQVWDINFENFYRSIGKIFSSKIEENFYRTVMTKLK